MTMFYWAQMFKNQNLELARAHIVIYAQDEETTYIWRELQKAFGYLRAMGEVDFCLDVPTGSLRDLGRVSLMKDIDLLINELNANYEHWRKGAPGHTKVRQQALLLLDDFVTAQMKNIEC